MKKINEKFPVCPVDYAFQRIGGKYKGRIIWNIHEKNVLRYGELKKIIVGVTTKMLTQTLRELEEDGLIVRKVYHQVPPKVEYTLTPAAQSLIPFIHYLRQWANEQLDQQGIHERIHPLEAKP